MIKSVINHMTAFILVLILLAHNINTLVIVGDFLINQDFIAKTLCIQKEEQKGCNGKCHLKKQLAQNDNNSNDKSPMQNSKRLSLDVFCVSFINVLEVPDVQIDLHSEIFAKNMSIFRSQYLEVDTPPPIFI